MSEVRQVVELRAPTGFEIVDIKLQLKPTKTQYIEKEKEKPVVKKRSNPPSLDERLVTGADECEICGGEAREGRGYCAKCFLEHCALR